VPPPSAILTPDDEKEDDDAWCKALICRQCGAVPLLERKPSGRTASPNTWLNEQVDLVDRQGWLLTENAHHRWLQAILNNVIYYLEEPPDNESEVDFSLPHPSDQVWLCWAPGGPVGFCVVKLKGTKVPGMDSTYGMNIVSAVFVRRSHRRQGLARSLLDKIFLVYQRPWWWSSVKMCLESFFVFKFESGNDSVSHSLTKGSHLGFSLPLSTGMEQLLTNQLAGEQAHRREEVWGCQGDGLAGDRLNLWWTFQNNNQIKEGSSV